MHVGFFIASCIALAYMAVRQRRRITSKSGARRPPAPEQPTSTAPSSGDGTVLWGTSQVPLRNSADDFELTRRPRVCCADYSPAFAAALAELMPPTPLLGSVRSFVSQPMFRTSIEDQGENTVASSPISGVPHQKSGLISILHEDVGTEHIDLVARQCLQCWGEPAC